MCAGVKSMMARRSCFFTGLPAVVTLTANIPDITLDDIPFPEACRRLEEAGAAVVGINCSRGPATILPLLRDVRKAIKVKVLFLSCPISDDHLSCAPKI